MRTPMVIANWKMYKNHAEALEFVNEVKDKLPSSNTVEAGVCAQSILLKELVENSNDTLKIGAQNMYYEDEGAFTGEISPAVLENLNIDYVILGHSERRRIFKEDDELINLKIKAAFNHNLIPILCVGEDLDERKAGKVNDVLYNQLNEDLKDLDGSLVSKLVIAYEPLWAINTGLCADSSDAEDACKFIRNFITEKYGLDISNEIRILYGGSVKVSTIKSFIDCENIDGALVGKDTLDPNNFIEMINIIK